MLFLLSHYLDPHSPDSLLCQPTLSISGPKYAIAPITQSSSQADLFPVLPKSYGHDHFSFGWSPPTYSNPTCFPAEVSLPSSQTFLIMSVPVGLIYTSYTLVTGTNTLLHYFIIWTVPTLPIYLCGHRPLLTVLLHILHWLVQGQRIGISKILRKTTVFSQNDSVSFFSTQFSIIFWFACTVYNKICFELSTLQGNV